MKKTYIKPATRIVPVFQAHALMAGSVFKKRGIVSEGLSREVDFSFDDEEEEIEDSMWK